MGIFHWKQHFDTCSSRCHNTQHHQFLAETTLSKTVAYVLPVSLLQEYATLNWVKRSVGRSTGLCPATTKFHAGVTGTTFFTPCTRVKVRVTLDQCIRTNFDSERSPRPHLCMGLRHSSFLFSTSDRVWLPPVPRQCLNAFRYGFLQNRHLFWAAVLMGMHFRCEA